RQHTHQNLVQRFDQGVTPVFGNVEVVGDDGQQQQTGQFHRHVSEAVNSAVFGSVSEGAQFADDNFAVNLQEKSSSRLFYRKPGLGAVNKGDITAHFQLSVFHPQFAVIHFTVFRIKDFAIIPFVTIAFKAGDNFHADY